MAAKSSKSSSKKSAEQQTKKAVTKSAPKTTQPSKDVKSTTSATSKEKKQISITKPKLVKALGIVVLVILTVILVDFVVQYVNNDYSVAIVNGERIPRSEYEKTLEDAYGAAIATQVINEALINQKAEEEGISVEDSEIDEMINKTKEELGGDEEYQAALESNGITEEIFRDRLKLQKVAEQLIVEEPTEDDLKAFFEEYKEVYWTPETTYEEVTDEIEDAYINVKFNEESGAWLAEITEESDIKNNVTEPVDYGILVITRGLFSDLNNRLDE